MFVKVETSWKFCAYVDCEESAPRCIVNASAFLRVILGPWMYKFAHSLRRNWNVTRNMTFECGYTNRTIGKWFERARAIENSVWCEIDYSRWDSTVSKEMIALGLEIFILFGMPRTLQRAYESMFSFKVTSRDGLSGTRAPCQKSGVPMTTVLNSLLNGLVTKFMLSKVGDYRAYPTMVRGDDMLTRAPPRMRSIAMSIAKGLGLKPKLKFGHDDSHVTFCSGAFWPTTEGFVFGPTLKAMFKVGYTTSPVPFTKWKQHAKGVALGLIKQTNHVPILGAYIRHLQRLTSSVPDDKWTRRAQAEARVKNVRALRTYQPSLLSNKFLCDRYSLGTDDVEKCERLVATATGCGFLVHPTLVRVAYHVFLVEA